MRKSIISGFFFLFSGLIAIASYPKATGWVNDFAGILNPEELTELNRFLESSEKESSNQIIVAIFPGIDGQDIFDFSNSLANEWKIGTAENENGVLLVFAMQERKVRIEVGYGLEGVLPDLICKDIIEYEVRPAFKRGAYFEGIKKAVHAVKDVAAGAGYHPKGKKMNTKGLGSLVIILIFLIIYIVIAIKSRKNQDNHPGGRGFYGGGWYGGLGGGGFGGGSSSWGSGGGGWSGGGGGSFGGGGASGGW